MPISTSAETSFVSVRMLGSMSIVVGGSRVSLDLGRNGRLLAGYLFEFPGQVNHREKLANMFWADLDATHARAALNTALWRIRRLIGARDHELCGRLQCRQHEVVLEPGPWLTVDTQVFVGRSRAALRPTGECGSGAAAGLLQGAVETYSGMFLEGDDADWVIAERERLQSLYIRCQCEVIKAHALVFDYESAIQAARCVLGNDPFRESVACVLALLLFLDGQRAQAIRELDRWTVALRTDLRAEPLAETRSLLAALVSGSISEQIGALKQRYFSPA